MTDRPTLESLRSQHKTLTQGLEKAKQARTVAETNLKNATDQMQQQEQELKALGIESPEEAPQVYTDLVNQAQNALIEAASLIPEEFLK